MDMQPAPAPLATPAPAQISPSILQNINPQQLMMASVMSDLLNNGGRNTGSIVQGMSALQPNQTATNNRTALQSLSGFQQQLSNQGGTGGLLGLGKRLIADIPVVGQSTGPGQFETNRQSTAAMIAQATGMSPQAALGYLPNFGDNPQSANEKIATLQTMLSSGYSGALNPSSLSMPGQQSFGGISQNLPGINAGNGMTSALSGIGKALGMGGGAADAAGGGIADAATTAGTTLAEALPEAMAF